MKIVGVSFSYSKDSMAYRGLTLMDNFLNFEKLIKIDLPMCDSNEPNGVVPDSVSEFCKSLELADVIVFSIPEYTAHYSAGFKNAMDWLVVKSNFNATLGKGYAISNKPVYVITFTPTFKGAGHRHFEMTTHLLEKLGANVVKCFVKNNGWDNVIPGNFGFVEEEATAILNTTHKPLQVKEEDMTKEVPTWNIDYNNWNKKWKS